MPVDKNRPEVKYKYWHKQYIYELVEVYIEMSLGTSLRSYIEEQLRDHEVACHAEEKPE